MDLLKEINSGIDFHSNGDYKDAEAKYLEVLAVAPNHPDAHNLLADLYHRLGDNIRGLYHANIAVSLMRSAQFLNTRGMVFIGMNRFQEAVSDLRAAVKLAPDLADSHNNLCIAYRHLTDYKRAVHHGRRAVGIKPELALGWLNLGAAQEDAGDLEGALSSSREAVRLAPDNGLAVANLGKQQYKFQDFSGAVASFESAFGLGLEGLDLRFAYAHSLMLLGQMESAANALEHGFLKASDFSMLPFLVVQPPFFELLYHVCGYFARVIGHAQRAVNLYERCLTVPGVEAAVWNNLGTIYFDVHQLPDAIRCYQEARKANPTLTWAHSNLGVCYSSQGESAKAIECFSNALAVEPNFPAALGWLLREKTFICDWEGFADLRQQVSALRNTSNKDPISPFVALSVYDDPAELHYWAKLSANEIFSPFANSPALCRPKSLRQRKKIRLGYYSYDFRNHPVAHLTSRLFDLHDKDRFDLYIYSYGPDDGSDIRRKIQASAKHFVDVKDLSVVDTARRIAEDDLDVLIDLTGNTLHHRSHVMALRPARIQAHWLGFIGTMGSPHYDYMLADDIVVPPGAEQDFSENILRLPGGMHIMDETRLIDSSHQTRLANGLPETGVVFGSFCQSFKIQPEIFARWMEVLRNVPGSVLWIASGPAGMEENLRKFAGQLGVDPARLIIAPRCGVEEYLSRFALIDLCLDTFPYTSGTVASDSLRAGCPLVTLTGRTMVSRMAGSILRHADMGDLVCESAETYVALATRLGNNPDELASLRQRLMQAWNAASLFNVPQAVKGLENSLISVVKSPKPNR